MRKKSSKTDISIVVPMFNEEKTVSLFIRAINKLIVRLNKRAEIFFINDGSTDETLIALKKSKLVCPSTIISFSRNFGHQAALLAGMESAQGEIIITMDGDLQHPPELIEQMIDLHTQGYDIVLTQRFQDQEVHYLKKASSEAFYKLFSFISRTTFAPAVSDFRSMNRRAVSALLKLPEHRKYLRGMVQWIGFKSVIIPYQARPRAAGTSKYSLIKMFKLAVHGLTSFSTLPLYLSGLFSMILFLLAVFYAIYVIIAKFVLHITVSGWASVIFVLLVIGGFLSLFMGLFGVYIAAIYEEVKQRPNYIIEKVIKK